jgi:hypothetical protein
MATITNKRLCAGTLSGTEATLYTTPASTTTIVKSITISNISAAAVTAFLALNDVSVMYGVGLAAGETITISPFDQIIHAGETIKGYSDTASAITYYISGKEEV